MHNGAHITVAFNSTKVSSIPYATLPAMSAWQVVESLHGLSLAGSGVIAWSQPGR